MPRKPTIRKPPGLPKGPPSTELLLEIGTEELPYQFVGAALHALRHAAETLLAEQRLSYGTLRTLGTPRRLVLLVEGLASRQAPAVKETMGPSKAVAFDQSGQPTKAAIGFAAGQGMSVQALEIRTTPKGEYVFAVKEEKGQAAHSVLAEVLSPLLGKLSFPKAMHWNETGVRFARPIRWIVALCDGKVLPIQFASVKAGDVSMGHRVLSADAAKRRGFTVKSIAQYLREAERQGVIVDQAKRREMILEQLDQLAKSARGRLHQDEELLEQAVYMVEYPHTILGSFKPHYLSLPKEVLMTSMKEHQGYFALVDQKGGLLPNFLAVTNMKLPNMQLIREGNERVLAARLADARFFFEEDRKVPLAERAKKLSQVTFHQKLGTMAQKQERVRKLAGLAASLLAPGNEEVRRNCERAAGLCKADLITGMVGEFPELQGIMGSEYAEHDGEPEAVSAGIREQYLPRSMEGELPQTLIGQVLSIADRMDSLAGFFHVGITPTGSEDPFALRRHATALIRTILECNHRLNLGKLIDNARNFVIADNIKGVPDSESEGRRRVADFIFERLKYYGRTIHGLREDVMEAVLHADVDRAFDLIELLDKMKAIHAISSQPAFDPLIVGFKRAHRLTEKEQWDRKPVDKALFREAAELELAQVLEQERDQFAACMAHGDYAGALDRLVRLKGPIDEFFNAVMVNTEDPAVRSNRLSLLKEVDDLFMSFADFSQIMVQGIA